ncbi:MAG TPA: 3-isopropylmalate dehydratase small subunit [Actinomycetota bacterium]|nr:3-isopropylmalate dehydratase small subunit [Actinomycetota bacterium]
MSTIQGKVHRMGANIDTDVIIPARYLTTTDPKELAKHCMEDLDPLWVQRVNPGDIIVAEDNFGSGSSREHAPVAIKGAGIACVVASTFARIFYRNSINVGLPIVECREIVEVTKEGDQLEVDLVSGTVTNLTQGITAQAVPFPEFMRSIIEAGGLVPYLRAKLGVDAA